VNMYICVYIYVYAGVPLIGIVPVGVIKGASWFQDRAAGKGDTACPMMRCCSVL